jgi:hypothetical protein
VTHLPALRSWDWVSSYVLPGWDFEKGCCFPEPLILAIAKQDRSSGIVGQANTKLWATCAWMLILFSSKISDNVWEKLRKEPGTLQQATELVYLVRLIVNGDLGIRNF